MTEASYFALLKNCNSSKFASSLYPINGVRCLHVNRAAVDDVAPGLLMKLGQMGISPEDWFAGSFGVWSEAQLAWGSSANCSPLRAAGPRIIGWRQSHMGRNCVVPQKMPSDSVWDVKGCGVHDGVVPKDHRQYNGMMSLTCAIKEYLMAEVLRKLEGLGMLPGVSPLRIVALLLLPEFGKIEGKKCACALLVREASVRDDQTSEPAQGSTEWQLCAETELNLRRVGLSTVLSNVFTLSEKEAFSLRTRVLVQLVGINEAGTVGVRSFLDKYGLGTQFSGLASNVQLAAGERGSATLVDFEGYSLRSLFANLPVIFPACDAPFGIGGFIDSNLIPSEEPAPAAVRNFAEIFSVLDCVPAHLSSYYSVPHLSVHGRIYSASAEILGVISEHGGDLRESAVDLTQLLSSYMARVQAK